MGSTLGQLLMAAGQADQARQVLTDSLAAATKIGWTDMAQQISDLLDPLAAVKGEAHDHPAGKRHGRDAEAARRSLQEPGPQLGPGAHRGPRQAAPAAGTSHEDGKAIDPVSVASLVLSLPSAALAVLDLADRIRKRRRADELIDHARQLAARQVSIYLITQGRAVELSTLTPDQLLDLQADEDPAS